MLGFKRRHLSAFVLAAACLPVGCAHPHAGDNDGQPVVETIRHSRTYEINPLNPNDLRRSVSDQWRCGGFECKIGETQSRTNYTYSSAMTPAGVCSLTKVHVRVETTITIPHWEPQGPTSAGRRNWWSLIRDQVVRHENHHVFIAEDGGKAIADSLMHLTGPNCMGLLQAAIATAHQEMQRISDLQQEFDRSEGPLQITAPPP